MKKLKIMMLVIVMLCLTGCIKKDNYENISIYTTIYPVTYITKYLYDDYAEINSIYPNGVDADTYEISNKKLNDFSKGDLFIYNGLSSEKDIAAELLNKNKKMDIIDVSQGLEVKSDVSELWLSPANFLMMMTNIKNNLKEYITNKSILDSIDENYENLKVQISEIDAELNLMADNASNKKIIVANNAFKFLEKYGFEVISVSAEDENSNTNISRAKKYFSSKENTYLFMLDNTEENETIKSLKDGGATEQVVARLLTLSEENSKNGTDYISYIKDILDIIKKEVY
jgi:zinc transport system substrate-binding protein